MSIQESILRKSSAVQRSLFNNKINVVGREIDVIRIGTQRDMYQNILQETIISENNLVASLHYPTEFPINRYRADAAEQVEETRTYFFDLLPIEAYFKFSDKVERDDLLFHVIWDENDNAIPVVLRVTESLGRFSTDLVWRKYYCAPENLKLDSGVLQALQQRLAVKTSG